MLCAQLERVVTGGRATVLFEDLAELRVRVRGTVAAVVAGVAVDGEVCVADVGLVVRLAANVGDADGGCVAELLLDGEVPAFGDAGLEVAREGSSEADLTSGLGWEGGAGGGLEGDRRVGREGVYAVGAEGGGLPWVMEVLIAGDGLATVGEALAAIGILDSVGGADGRVGGCVRREGWTEGSDVGSVIVSGVGYWAGEHAEGRVK